MKEIWKDIIGYEKLYQVSNLGNVRRYVAKIKGYKIKKTFVHSSGYITTILYKGGIGKCYRVHIIVADTFLHKENGNYVVNHIDCDKTNNKVSNLEWCSQKENIRHAIINNRFSKSKKKCAKTLNGKIISQYDSVEVASKIENVSKPLIYHYIETQKKTPTGHKWCFL